MTDDSSINFWTWFFFIFSPFFAIFDDFFKVPKLTMNFQLSHNRSIKEVGEFGQSLIHVWTFLPTLIHEVRASPINPGGHLQVNCPVNPWGIQIALGPQGLGLHGSGLSTHFWFWQMYPVLQSGSTVHSGPHPVMVSGFGTSPAKHRQIGFPSLLAMHIVPGPQGLGSQGSGFKTHLQWSQQFIFYNFSKRSCIIHRPKSPTT